MAVIYMITNKVNGKKYIGQTWDYRRRKTEHARGKKNYPINQAFRKYGEGAFSWRIVYAGINSQTELNRVEARSIARFNTLAPKGYNLLAGDQREKRIGQALENQRAGLHRVMNTPEWRAQPLQQLRKMHANPEWHKRHDAAMARNALNPEWQRKHAAMIASISKPVHCLESGIIYESCKEAERRTGIDASSISAAARGERITAGGYVWEYLNGAPKAIRVSKEKAVICLTTGERFDSAVKAARVRGLKPHSINQVCSGRTRTLFGQRWIYERRSA